MAEGVPLPSKMHSVNIRKRALHILHLIDSDPDVEALVHSCVKATNVNGCALLPPSLPTTEINDPTAGLHAWRAAEGLIALHWLSVPPLNASGVHICKGRQTLFRVVNG